MTDQSKVAAAAAALMLAACNTQPNALNVSNTAPSDSLPAEMPGNESAVPIADSTPTAAPGDVASQRPLSEAEAALGVASEFARLLSTRDFAGAYAMWKDGGSSPRPSASEFAAKFAGFSSLTVRAEPPSNVEGAAGSLYADVPLTLTGLTAAGTSGKRSGTLTLKRVNDVPGATPEQLQWHIVDVKL